MEERKDQKTEQNIQDTEASQQPEGLKASDAQTESEQIEEPATPVANSERTGRMVAAGVLTAVILSVVAVVVAGILRLTAGWLVVCPTDLPVNDPAKYLSKQLTEEKVTPQPLGVAGKVAEETRLKSPAQVQTESSSETGKGN